MRTLSGRDIATDLMVISSFTSFHRFISYSFTVALHRPKTEYFVAQGHESTHGRRADRIGARPEDAPGI